MRRNWSDTVDLAGSETRPHSAAEVAELVRSHDPVLALGSAHSFSNVAVTPGLHVDTTALPADIHVEGTTATVGAGTTYAVLGRELHARGMALEVETGMAIERARTWLRDHGNPYVLSVLDIDGRVGIDFGVYGVPETFVIDKQGVIRHKHIGPVTPEAMQKKIIPLVRELQKQP